MAPVIGHVTHNILLAWKIKFPSENCWYIILVGKSLGK